MLEEVKKRVMQQLRLTHLFSLLVLVVVLLTAGAAQAQVLYGAIIGTVADNTGAVIPNVGVTLTNTGTGDVHTVTTSGTGDYGFRNVLPGTYTVAVQRTGAFAGYSHSGIVVNANQQIRIDATLQPGTVTEQVQVNSATQIMQTETANVNHEITQTQLAQLPITSSQGRSFQALYTIVPGAAAVQEKNSSASNPSRAMSVNVNGMSYNGNTTRIDGAMNYYGWLPYLIAYVPPADSIANVNIDTNSFNAEQGQAGGAVIGVTTKSGTRNFHGAAWEYYQDAGLNARPYTASTSTVPKNVFHQFGFNVGGPVYIPHILTGRSKLFFFDNFERTTRRQLITGTVTVPDAKMIGGDFSEVASTFPLYDPQPGGVGAYLPVGSRPTFMSEYGCNCIPTSRQSTAASTMLALLKPIATAVGTPTPAQLASQMSNDYLGSGTLAYNRNTNDAKITYIPTDKTQIFGKYSIEPFSINDPQNLGAAGGGTFDGGQPGAASGRIQNVGLGLSHVFSTNLVIDWDFGYTRQVTGAQSTVDLALGDYGTDVLKIPGTNGQGRNYIGQPYFGIGTIASSGASTGFSSVGNANGASPFLFRDNQFTTDVNLSWTKGTHATKYGFTWYHFDLNHFQPTSGGGISNPRGGFAFQGGMTAGPSGTLSSYGALADMLLGLPNQTGGAAVAKAVQIANPNALRWTEIGAYAQDQWKAMTKLTINYGIRYEYYPVPYRDHTGIYILDPMLPQSGNVVVGGVGGQSHNAGLSVGWGFVAPRIGLAYRLNDKTVIRSGFGMTSDPDSMRFLRDSFPMDLAPSYSSPAANTIAVDPANNNAPMTLAYGIPVPAFPRFPNGIASLPVSGSTTTVIKNFRRGYIESWNLFVQRELGANFVANVGYVGTQSIRQPTQTGYLNSSPLPTSSSICMPNKQFNPSSPYYNGTLGNNPCSFAANQLINMGAPCPPGTAGSSLGTCYNTGGIGTVVPLFNANYNGLQTQLRYNGGAMRQFGVVYTLSKAINSEDNGAGSGSGGLAWNYPGYYYRNRALAGFDQKNNLQIYGIYGLPFGHGHRLASAGFASVILGGWQLNGQYSHVSGIPFTVSANSNTANAQGEPLYANLIAPYKQIGSHARSSTAPVGGGRTWFDPTSFANPVQPTYTATQTPSQIQSPVFGNTNRNQFRGPGISYLNASVVREFHIYRETAFQFRFETFNTTNHPQLTTNPGTTVGSSTFGRITTFGNARAMQFGGRFLF